MEKAIRYDDCPVCVMLGKEKGDRGRIERKESCMPRPYDVCPVCNVLLNVVGDLAKPVYPVMSQGGKEPLSPIFYRPSLQYLTERRSLP